MRAEGESRPGEGRGSGEAGLLPACRSESGMDMGGHGHHPRVPRGLAGNSVPVFGLAGVSPSLGLDASTGRLSGNLQRPPLSL